MGNNTVTSTKLGCTTELTNNHDYDYYAYVMFYVVIYVYYGLFDH